MDIFDIHNRVVSSYSRYVDSFLTVDDEAIRTHVRSQLFEERALLPDALVQLNAAYEKAASVDDLVAGGHLHPSCADVVRTSDGAPLTLYRHQVEAGRCAAEGRSFVVTSGTGSGKTVAFLLPIFDAVLRNRLDTRASGPSSCTR